MSEAQTQSEVPKADDQQAANLKYMKIAHDNHATVCHLLKTRVQFFHEEFAGIMDLVNFYGALRDQLLLKIHEIEPPAPEEAREPMVIDAGEIKPQEDKH